jgi:4a-hydroxytetrahydrobiopterin dehydratase
MSKSTWNAIGSRLIKTFYFKGYTEVTPFVQQVMKLASKQNHHPSLIVNYDHVKISITNNEKQCVSDACHRLAKSIDGI